MATLVHQKPGLCSNLHVWSSRGGGKSPFFWVMSDIRGFFVNDSKTHWSSPTSSSTTVCNTKITLYTYYVR